MKVYNLYKERHYRNFVLHLPIAESEYYEILDHGKRFRECLVRIHRERPELFPEDFGEDFLLKDKQVSRYYGICIRSIRLRLSKRIFSILPDFIKIDFQNDPETKSVWSPKEIIRSVLAKDADSCSLFEPDFRRDHPKLYYAALEVYGTWKLVLETAGFSPRKSKMLCSSFGQKTSCR